MSSPRNLYNYTSLYDRVFPVDADEVNFFHRLAPAEGILLDAGCGTGRLAAALRRAGLEVTGLDIEPSMVRQTPGAVAGDLNRLPFRDGAFAAAFSRLFGCAYAAGAHTGGPEASIRELGRTLTPGARVALEIPLAWNPERLRGIAEEAQLEEGRLLYTFQYLDVIARNRFGAILESSIQVREGNCVYPWQTPLQVYTPEGAREWFRAGGLELQGFCAPYDWESLCPAPPEDCLRGVAAGRRL